MDANVSTMTMPKTMPVQNLCRYISFKSFTDRFHDLDKKLSKSIVKIAPDINKYLRNALTIQTIQDIAKF